MTMKTAKKIGNCKHTTQPLQQQYHPQPPAPLNTQKPAQQRLLNRIVTLEETVENLEKELAVSKNTNSLLVQEIDNLHQYQRQACLNIDGMEPCKDETDDQITEKAKNLLPHNLGLTREDIQFEIDKCNCLGQ